MKAGSSIPSWRRGFTLVELLVSTGVLAVLLVVSLTALDSMQRSWRDTKGKVGQFRSARTAFEAIIRNLSQATLNTYWDYYYTATKSNIPPASSSAPPAGYVRHSELEFCILNGRNVGGSSASAAEYPGHGLFFQAPLGHSRSYRGLANLLNARGYYIRFGSNESRRPAFLSEGLAPIRYRYQLMEYRPPAEQGGGEGDGSATLQGNTIYTRTNWFDQDLEKASRPIADNILFLHFSPQVSQETLAGTGKQPWWIAPAYRYSSRDSNNATPEIDGVNISSNGSTVQGTQHLLPPLVRVTLVAADESSMSRWMASRNNEPVDILNEASAPFTEAQHYHRDLERLKQYLTEQRLNFRVFSSTVALRNAVWDSSTY